MLMVLLFRSSSALASAYGIAVTIDMTITTVMTFFVIRYGWRYPLALCLLTTGFFFIVDVTFFLSNMLKLLAGLDMYMVPDDWRTLHANLMRDVHNGTIPMARVDEAAGRVLRPGIRLNRKMTLEDAKATSFAHFDRPAPGPAPGPAARGRRGRS